MRVSLYKINTISKLMVEVNNFFIHKTLKGSIKKEGEVYILPQPPLNGQYIYIYGTQISDGLYQHVDGILNPELLEEIDECFINYLIIPRTFLNLSLEIDNYAEKQIPGLVSESFGDFAQTFTSGKDNTWVDLFQKDLSNYRKMFKVPFDEVGLKKI